MDHLLSFCEGFGTKLSRCFETPSQSSPLTAVVADLVDAVASHQHLPSLVCRRLHSQLLGCYAVFVHSPVSMLPSQFLGIRQLTLHGLAALGAIVEGFCIAVAMLLS